MGRDIHANVHMMWIVEAVLHRQRIPLRWNINEIKYNEIIEWMLQKAFINYQFSFVRMQDHILNISRVPMQSTIKIHSNTPKTNENGHCFN